ncbi:MAG: hypothetical protein ABQ298_03710 [Puniceicoccaceae bacterium]
MILLLALVALATECLSSTPLIVGGQAPAGDANAWVAQMESRRFPQSNSDFYHNKVLAVPSALDRGGSFPTCAAMILLYHNKDLHFFPEHIQNFLTPEAQNLIASAEYFADYYYPDDSNTVTTRTDKSGPLGQRSTHWAFRENNSVADYCQTSQSYIGLRAGWTLATYWENYSLSGNFNGMRVEICSPSAGGALFALEDEVLRRIPYPSGIRNFRIFTRPDDLSDDDKWSLIKQYIDEGFPIIGLIGDFEFSPVRATGAAVAIVGYAEHGDTRVYAAYNTASHDVQWYRLNSRLSKLVEVHFHRNSPAALAENAVHRFFNPSTGAYFFTAFNAEAQNVIDNLPAWQYQGPVFRVEYGDTAENIPVYRFYNNRAGAHFYTANEQEKENVIANLAHQYAYEGIAFFVRAYAQPFNNADPSAPTYYPIYRCYLPQTSSHYFTASKSEVDHIQANVDPSLIRYEGIAWYSDYIWDVR